MADLSPAPDQDAILAAWCADLVTRLGLDGVEVDVDAVLSLAGQVAHAVVRPAAPLTAYVVGYAAGLAVGSGSRSSSAASGNGGSGGAASNTLGSNTTTGAVSYEAAFATAAATARDAAASFVSAS